MEDTAEWIALAVVCAAIAGVFWQDRERYLRPSVRVQGEVIGHRESISDGDDVYAAIYRFTADGARHEVLDNFYTASRRPEIGSVQELRYPQGRPDLARPPRTAFWMMTYFMLAIMAGLIIARMTGAISG